MDLAPLDPHTLRSFDPATASDASIRQVQAFLGVKPDGDFGAKSRAALKVFLDDGPAVQHPVHQDRPAPAPAGTAVLTDADRAPLDARSETNLATLDPRVQPFFRALINRCLAARIVMVLTSGSRTYEQQAELHRLYLAGEGGKAAEPGHSNHNFDHAGDVTEFSDATHETPIWDGPNYRRAGLIGEALGLFWGGRWTGRDEDQPHFEFRPSWAANVSEGAMIAELRRRHEDGVDLLAS